MLYTIKKDVDTRDTTDLWVLQFTDKMTSAEYQKTAQSLKTIKCYYSSFKKGFISKNEITASMIDELLNSSNEPTAATTTTAREKATTTKIEYKKLFTDYLTVEQALIKALEHSEKVTRNRVYTKEEYYKGLKNDIENLYNGKRDYSNELQYIRQAIIYKSLGLDKADFNANGSNFYYNAIWDLLPIIEGLSVTDEYFSASWGYDQTNIDIAFRLNKKVFGLDCFKELDGNILLKRVKVCPFHNDPNMFTFDDGCRTFYKGFGDWRDDFKHDASQTGQYR